MAQGSASPPPGHRPTPSMGFGKYLAGRQAQVDANSGAAASYYFEALKNDPTNVMLARRAYSFLLAEGEIKTGMAVAQRVMELDPTSSFAPLMLAVDAVDKGNPQRAVDLLSQVDQQGLNMVMVPLIRAWSFAGLKQWDAAITALAPLRDELHLDAVHDFHAGLILEQAERPEDARAAYAKSLLANDAPTVRAIQIVSSFLVRNGHQAEAEKLIDSVRAEQGQAPLIVALFGKPGSTKALDPKARPPVATAKDGMAEAMFTLTTLLSSNNLQDMAMISARLSIALRPDFPFSTYMIASILEKQQRYPEEVAILSEVPKASPAYYQLRLRLAASLDQLERSDEALKVLRDLQKTYPDQVDPVVGEAGILHRQKKWIPAADLYAKALSFFPKPTADQWRLIYAMGMCLERGKRWPQAEKALKQALELAPDNPSVLNYLGYSWIDRGINLDEGKALIEKAVSLRPTEGYIIDSLGWAYYLTGDYPRAVEELEKAIEYTPGDATINEHLGDAYWRVGRFNEARFQWQRALTLDPEPDMIAPIQEKLKKGLPAAKPKK